MREPPIGGVYDYAMLLQRVKRLEERDRELREDFKEHRTAVTKERKDEVEREFTVRLQRPVVLIAAASFLTNVVAIVVTHH